MSREEWWDQEITSVVIVLTITCDWVPRSSVGPWASYGAHECRILLRHLLPTRLYNLSVIEEHQATVNYYQISHWLIRVLSDQSTLTMLNNSYMGLSYWND